MKTKLKVDELATVMHPVSIYYHLSLLYIWVLIRRGTIKTLFVLFRFFRM